MNRLPQLDRAEREAALRDRDIEEIEKELMSLVCYSSVRVKPTTMQCVFQDSHLLA